MFSLCHVAMWATFWAAPLDFMPRPAKAQCHARQLILAHNDVLAVRGASPVHDALASCDSWVGGGRGAGVGPSVIARPTRHRGETVSADHPPPSVSQYGNISRLAGLEHTANSTSTTHSGFDGHMCWPVPPHRRIAAGMPIPPTRHASWAAKPTEKFGPCDIGLEER